MNTFVGLASVVALVLLNAFFVATEFAFVGARRTRINQLAEEGRFGAESARHAIQHLDSYIAATQLGITLASLGLGWVGEAAVGHIIEGLFVYLLPTEVAESLSHTLALPVSFAIVTMLHIVFGELAPKSIALQQPEVASMIVAPFTRIFRTIFFPVIWSMNLMGNAIVRLIGFDPASAETQVHSRQELAMLFAASREAGMLQRREEEILSRAVSFREIPLEEIMKPRVDVVAFPVDTSLKTLLKTMPNHRHTRYVVYGDSIDDVRGILHMKDLFDHLAKANHKEFALAEMLRQPLYLPATTPISSVLTQMQREKMHFAIVLDEFGGTAGIATLEDILEELVGEVQDEFDQESPLVYAEGNEFMVDGGLSMSEIEERFGAIPQAIESNTIGGWIAETLQRIPRLEDRLLYGEYEVSVLEMDGLRVEKVRFKKRGFPDG